jgi:hypothetical protein
MNLKFSHLVLACALGISLLFSSLNSVTIGSPNNSNSAYAQEQADISGPEILSTIPSDGETNVPEFTAVVIEFNEPIDVSTLTTKTFTVGPDDGSGATVEAEISVDDSGFNYTLRPTENIQFSTTYIVTIEDEVRDLAGNSLEADYVFTFATADQNVTPPEVVITIPTDAADDVPVYQTVVARFTEEIVFSDFENAQDSFTLENAQSNQVEGFVFHQGSDPLTASFSPASHLEFSTTYTATIHGEGFMDFEGNEMTSDYSWTFTTKSEKEATAKVSERVTLGIGHATWEKQNSDGGTTVTDLNVEKDLNSDSAMIVSVNQDVTDADGNLVAFQLGSAPIQPHEAFELNPNLKEGSLSPIELDVSSCILTECTEKTLTIEVEWTGTGRTDKVKEQFNGISDILDTERTKFNLESLLRNGIAVGSVNGEDLGDSEFQRTFLSISDDILVKSGDFDLALQAVVTSDYDALTDQLGNKAVRGGEGWVANANWVQENDDGSTTYTFLSAAEGFEQVGRVSVFLDGTSIFLDRATFDADGNFVEDEFGSAFTTADILNVKNKSRSAQLSLIEITVCSFEDRDESFECVDGTTVIVQANWDSIGKVEVIVLDIT